MSRVVHHYYLVQNKTLAETTKVKCDCTTHCCRRNLKEVVVDLVSCWEKVQRPVRQWPAVATVVFFELDNKNGRDFNDSEKWMYQTGYMVAMDELDWLHGYDVYRNKAGQG